MAWQKLRHRQKIDYVLALAIFILAVFGIIMIFSASDVMSMIHFGNPYGYVSKQVIALILGIIVWIIMTLVDYHYWQRWAMLALIITMLFLVAVFLPGIGIERNGAHRWINLGFFSFQPSEIVKLTFLLYLAAWLAKKGEKINSFSVGFVPFLVIIGVLTFLIMKQPDMGTLSVMVVLATVVFFVSGVDWKYILLYLGGAAVLFRLLIISAPYRLQRLLVFLNPNQEATSGSAYHINQAMLAIGSGGLLGLGFEQSKQKHLFLPEPFTDSIFAVIGEELGFLRILLVIALFTLIAWKGFQISMRAPDTFGRLVAAGITSWFIWQAFINIGAMIGLVPLTGVPLPFVSYGGTALVINFAAAGILLNISRQRVNIL